MSMLHILGFNLFRIIPISVYFTSAVILNTCHITKLNYLAAASQWAGIDDAERLNKTNNTLLATIYNAVIQKGEQLLVSENEETPLN